MGEDAGRAGKESPDGLIDDDVALSQPWGFDVAQVDAPVLLVHGREDRVSPFAHSAWLLDHLPNAELWSVPGTVISRCWRRFPSRLTGYWSAARPAERRTRAG